MTVLDLTFRTADDRPVTLAPFLTAEHLLLIFLRHLV